MNTTSTNAVSPSQSYSSTAAQWYLALGFHDLPDDIIGRTKLHVLDILGLALAGAARDSGRSVRAARSEASAASLRLDVVRGELS